MHIRLTHESEKKNTIKIRLYFEGNDNENITYAAKTVLKGKIIALNMLEKKKFEN